VDEVDLSTSYVCVKISQWNSFLQFKYGKIENEIIGYRLGKNTKPHTN
jgi:hypothetical protein